MQVVFSPGITEVNECIRLTHFPSASIAKNRQLFKAGSLKYALPSGETGTSPKNFSTENVPPADISAIAPV